jgi:hypothetical protein
MFSPTLGRWTQNDPIEFEAGDPNLYRFVGNNPTNYTDPSGLKPFELGGDFGENKQWWFWHPGNASHERDNILAEHGIEQLTLEGGKIARLGETPNSMMVRVNGGSNWQGWLKKGQVLEVQGAGPCVGVILIPPGVMNDGQLLDYLLAFHFTAKDDPIATIAKYSKHDFSGYTAVFCGSERNRDDQADRTKTLDATWRAVNRLNVKKMCYVPAPNVAVDTEGKILWSTPDSVKGDYLIKKK